MPESLKTRQFSEELAATTDVQAFECGEEAWSRDMADFIKSQRVIDSITRKGNECWLYYREDDTLVGFGTVGKTTWRIPAPNGPSVELSIIPAVAVQSGFQGCPKGQTTFARLIMSDLAAKARKHGTDKIGLFVHEDNARAIRFYENIGFGRLTGEFRNHIRMLLELPQ